jgi:hypothetical protein
MEEGISIDEACANNVIGTKEDFERSCNPDGTVKKQTDTTTYSLKNSDSSFTVNNTNLQIGVAATVIAVIILAVLIIIKSKHKSR